MTESELLGEVCDSFGGTQRLADAIGITRRPVLRWNAGDDPVPAGIWEKIERVLGERLADYQRLRELVREARVKAGG